MDEIETSEQRSGGTEAERRSDGAGRHEPLPSSEAARGNEQPKPLAETPEKVRRPGPNGMVIEEDSGVAAAETR